MVKENLYFVNFHFASVLEVEVPEELYKAPFMETWENTLRCVVKRKIKKGCLGFWFNNNKYKINIKNAKI